MTDAEFAAQKARVQALADRWIGPLGLKWWNVTINHNRYGFNRTDAQVAEDTRTIMTCSVMWQYLKATITVNTPELEELDDDRLEEIFVHELAHIFVHEMRDLDRNDPGWLNHEERVVTQLGRAFQWLRDHEAGAWRERLEAAHKGVDD